MYSMNDHRVISLQHRCIEPLGECPKGRLRAPLRPGFAPSELDWTHVISEPPTSFGRDRRGETTTVIAKAPSFCVA
jgi:hypothetical protein